MPDVANNVRKLDRYLMFSYSSLAEFYVIYTLILQLLLPKLLFLLEGKILASTIIFTQRGLGSISKMVEHTHGSWAFFCYFHLFFATSYLR